MGPKGADALCEASVAESAEFVQGPLAVHFGLIPEGINRGK